MEASFLVRGLKNGNSFFKKQRIEKQKFSDFQNARNESIHREIPNSGESIKRFRYSIL